MNTQILIPLDDMTPENGATSLRPRSQVEIEYPTNVEEYRSKDHALLFLKKTVETNFNNFLQFLNNVALTSPF